MTDQQETKARIQYSSRDELDVAVIRYCRGRSRHDLHDRTRSALNGFYGPFAMAAIAASNEAVRRQAMRSIRQLTTQILEIKEQFLPELLDLEAKTNGLPGLRSLTATTPYPEGEHGQRNGSVAQPKDQSSFVPKRLESHKAALPVSTPSQQVTDAGPMDEQLREFLGEDAAILAGLNPFINDLT
jgi:hypothetical protein